MSRRKSRAKETLMSQKTTLSTQITTTMAFKANIYITRMMIEKYSFEFSGTATRQINEQINYKKVGLKQFS